MKPTLPIWAPAVLAVLAIAPAAKAQQGPPHGGHRPPNALIQALDTDKDHKLSADEIKNAATALATLDTNGDGKISKDELRPKPPKDAPEGANTKDDGTGPPPPEDGGGKGGPGKGHGGPGGGGPGGKGGDHKGPKDPVLEALDTNGDGELSADEIAAAATSLAKLDTNGDGVITEDEFRPKPPTDGKDSKDSKTK